MTGVPATSAPDDVPSPRREELGLADVVARLRRAMRRAARVRGSADVLSVAQLELLSCVAENPGVRPSRLARLLQLAPNSVTTLVNGLVSRGLLSRTGKKGDRRAVSLALTPPGESAVHQWQATNEAILQSALQQLHAGQQELLAAAMPALRELVHAIDAQADSPAQEGSEQP